jgi:hypothetical protein
MVSIVLGTSFGGVESGQTDRCLVRSELLSDLSVEFGYAQLVGMHVGLCIGTTSWLVKVQPAVNAAGLDRQVSLATENVPSGAVVIHLCDCPTPAPRWEELGGPASRTA